MLSRRIEGDFGSTDLFDSNVIEDFCGRPLNENQGRGRGDCCQNNVNGRIGNDCDRRRVATGVLKQCSLPCHRRARSCPSSSRRGLLSSVRFSVG